MAKTFVLGLLVIAVIAGVADAQENAKAIIDEGNIFGFTWSANFMTKQGAYFDTRTLITPYAANDAEPEMPWGGNPAIAGLVNSLFGIWSWTNGDIFGGVLTSVLQLGGLVLALSAPLVFKDTLDIDTVVYMTYGSYALVLGGTVFGVVRGITQYNKMAKAYRATNLAEALSDNPLKNVSFTIVPTKEKRIAGALTYSVSF